LPYKYIGLSV